MFMKKFNDKKKDTPMNFADAQLYPFTIITAKEGNIMCSAKTFDGVDPNPGQEKQCYCAKEKTVKPEVEKSMLEFWIEKKQQVKLEDLHVKAVVEAQVNQ
jgi:hypothetical protein